VRIAVLIDRFRPGKGGAEVWLARFAAAARARGDSVLLATRDGRDPGVRSAFDGWVRVPCGVGPRFLADRAFARNADRAARDAGADATLGIRHVLACDVYQPHGGLHRAALEGTLASLESGPVRAARRAARAISPKQRTLLALEDRLLDGEGARRVIALSPRVLRDLERFHPAAARRAVVIPPGTDLDRFRPRERARRGPPVALFLAREPRLKGLGPLLDALARVRAGGVDLRLVAAGFPPEGWARRAERLGLGSAVSFPGPAERPEDLHAGADLLAHPTFYDPCSLVALEALAAGLPVVTTEANGAAAWIGRRAGEVVAEPRDAEALAGALARCAAGAREPGTAKAARRSAEAAGGRERLEEVLALLRAPPSAPTA
jgi:UDP-glucose:(heptosyl)LPS alpha-1,3-glucosyltransferase